MRPGTTSSDEAMELESGMKDIAAFYNLPVPKAGRLARQNLLPGVFRLGRGYCLDKATARATIREKAKGAK